MKTITYDPEQWQLVPKKPPVEILLLLGSPCGCESCQRRTYEAFLAKVATIGEKRSSIKSTKDRK